MEPASEQDRDPDTQPEAVLWMFHRQFLLTPADEKCSTARTERNASVSISISKGSGTSIQYHGQELDALKCLQSWIDRKQ